MRFIVMHKNDAKMEAGTPPDGEIFKQMGALIGESLRSKVFLNGAGLHRSARRVRVTSTGQVERGPYRGERELVESMALIRTASIDAAVDEARRYATALGAEIEIGPVVEAWDLTGAPKPADVQGERFLLLFKGDAAYERGQARPEQETAQARLDGELERRGVLAERFRIAPSSTGRRLSGPSGKRTWTDGPFAESKELIAGFSIIDLPSLTDAIAWADRYAAILVDNEVDVRRMAD
jgi:hypothetical protein